jgi:hypothetical protein
MTKKCCVFGCSTNYSSGEKGTVYRFPRNVEQRQRWISTLPNRNFVWSNDSVICEKHWPVGYTTRKVQGGHVQPVDLPSVFPNVPASCLPTPLPPARSEKNTLTIRNAQADEMVEFLERDKFTVEKLVGILLADRDDLLWFQTSTEVSVIPVHQFTLE